MQRYDDQPAAERAIRDREVYGALVVRPGGPPSVLTASAASPAVAQILTQMGQQMSAPADATAVRDVVPAPADDPRGAGLSTSVLPLILGGVLATIVLDRLTSRPLRRAVAVVVFAGASGLVIGLVLHVWLGALEGSYWTVSGVAALGVAALGLTLTGLHALLGAPGMGLGAATMMLLGNPLSGMSSAPEMLPTGWSTIGQLLPPGAFGSLVRSASFFDGARSGGPLLVLLAWILLGLAMCWTAHARGRVAPEVESVDGERHLVVA
ncbi:hypothetical protein [Luteipulveratus mongoliensis]|uniref:hypothetical protein n=1 Tax=Luteipulveratus mongoliensis TaxID=571913 RepID=UPI000ADFC8BE|nr:hypothetical protein [Luteipulveratus mongoliensis]